MLQPDLSRLVQLVAPAAGPKVMQPQQADLASSGSAIAAACRRLRDECLGPGMRRLFSFDFACSLRVIERQALLAAEPRTPFSAPVTLKGRRGVGTLSALSIAERRVAGSDDRGHVSSEGARGSYWGVALRFTDKWSRVTHGSVDGASAWSFLGTGGVHRAHVRFSPSIKFSIFKGSGHAAHWVSGRNSNCLQN